MANQAYNYSSSYGGGGSGLSSFLSSRLSSSGLDPYLSAPSSLIGSSRYLNVEPASFSAFPSGRIGADPVFSPIRNIGVDPAMVSDLKRTSEARYHQNLLGTHSTFGQSEALFSANALAKRPKLETASNLPIYPQRSGEKTCTHYMLTRICKFGDNCKFDHPLWVPEGGIPDWKEVVLTHTSESLPERPGEPDCPYYMKTQKCKFGLQCKFNHPKGTSAGGIAGHTAESTVPVLPERPSQPICSFYARTGTCKYGANCMYHHPKDIQLPSTGQNPTSTGQMMTVKGNEAVAGGPKPENPFVPFIPALLHNSMGLPIRPGETDCPFYLKAGSCKFGANCRFSHPEISSNNVPVPGAIGHSTVPPAATLPTEAFNLANILPNIERLAQAALGLATTSIYPQRPGQTECDFYMKTGQCKFGERCRYHHPIDASAPAPAPAVATQAQQNVKLTLAGLPRREGAGACQYYMKTGACKFGATCRFDHPPPGEAVAMATNPAQLYGASKEEQEQPSLF